MKVCLINNLYGRNAVGGAEKVVQARVLEYKKNGDEVFVITTKANKKPSIEKKIENGIMIYYVYISNIFYYKNLSKHGFILKSIWHLVDVFGKNKIIKKILKEEKPDIVETHNLMGIKFSQKSKVSAKGGSASGGKSQKSVRWRHFLHDVQLVEPSGVLAWDHKKDNIWQRVYSWIMKRKFKGVDEVIVPSEFLRDFYFKRGFFVDSKWRCVVRNRHACSVRESSPAPNSKFLFVGSLVEHKGIRVLMQAWDKISVVGNRHAYSVRLHIVGDGVLREEVEKWANGKNNVKVYGRLEGNKLEEVYNNCDTLIFPSICLENNPTVIHEAHQHGLRVIASDTGGVMEIIFDNDILVEPRNVEELAGKM